jgi:hypothetical protein
MRTKLLRTIAAEDRRRDVTRGERSGAGGGDSAGANVTVPQARL